LSLRFNVELNHLEITVLEVLVKEFYLKRIESNSFGTFGVLIDRRPVLGIPFALTVEPPWRDNKKYVSCIPLGSYLCRSVDSPRFGHTWEVTGVDGRTHILFHKGNRGAPSIESTSDKNPRYSSDTQGCILVGEEFGILAGGQPGLLSSSRGFSEFLKRANSEYEFRLKITEECASADF